MSTKLVTLALLAMIGGAQQMKIDPARMGAAQATLTPKQNTQSVTIPGDMDLAILADSTESSGGNSVSCGRALRFRSESGGQYVLRFTPHRPWHAVDCKMTLVESRDGQEVSVPSAHDAMLEDKGFWKGSELNICAE